MMFFGDDYNTVTCGQLSFNGKNLEFVIETVEEFRCHGDEQQELLYFCN